jgi:hypothetical protein
MHRQLGSMEALVVSALEKHYSPGQVAELWETSAKTIRELFRHEPDVLKIERPERRSKRGYTTLRIPESVLTRVHARLRNHADTTKSERRFTTGPNRRGNQDGTNFDEGSKH